MRKEENKDMLYWERKKREFDEVFLAAEKEKLKLPPIIVDEDLKNRRKLLDILNNSGTSNSERLDILKKISLTKNLADLK